MNEDDEEFGVDMGPATEPHTRREIELARDNERLRSIIDKLKVAFAPQYNALLALYGNAPPISSKQAPAELPFSDVGPRGRLSLFLEKAGNGVRGKMLKAIIEHGKLNKKQLATIADTRLRSSSFKDSLSWMKANRLANVSGDEVTLA